MEHLLPQRDVAMRTVVLIVVACVTLGCEASPSYTKLDYRADSGIETVSNGYGSMPVFYVTSRAATGAASVAAAFDAGRAKEPVFGIAKVMVPRHHAMGGDEITSQLTAARRQDTFAVEDLDPPVGQAKLIEQLKAEIEKRVTDPAHEHQRNLLVFVHGYNTRFPGNVAGGARLAYDIGGGMVPLVYSWPTRGTYWGYPDDENNVEIAAPHLAQLLQTLLKELPDTRIHVVAHSMGARVVMHALRSLKQSPLPAGRKLQNVVFAAADVDADVFAYAVKTDAITTLAHRTTLYVSDNDRALQASEVFHGRTYRRAGQGGEGRLSLPGVETIDVSLNDMSALGHGYAQGNRAVITDLHLLLVHDLPARKRNLLYVPNEHGLPVAWLIRP